MATRRTQVFRVSLRPRLYREIEIDSRASLYRFAEAITDAFGFFFDHPFGFYSALKGNFWDAPVKYELFADLEDCESDAKSVERTTVAQAFAEPGTKMRFVFDYGDQWHFTVELKEFRERVPKMRYPKLLAAVGKAPEQYPDEEKEPRSG